MKLLHDVKVIIIILVGVTILFAILGSFKLMPSKEGYKDAVEGCDGEVVPECHDNVISEGSYENDANSDYILKTEMIAPVCPSCPVYNELNTWENDKWDNSWENNKYYSDIDENKPYEEIDHNMNNTQQIDQNINNTQKIDQNINNTQKIDQNINNTQNIQGANMVGDMAGSNVKQEPIAAPVSSPAPVKEECPPCPACDRCPEPAFECKKVPNYRSSSINNYMPVPILNDFSKF